MFELKLQYSIRGKRPQCDTREMKVIDFTFKKNMKINILKIMY